jgi:cytochrome c peroxidase
MRVAASTGALVLFALACIPPSGSTVSLNERELLGEKLFFDTSLSQPKGQSCSSCHDPQHAFSGNAGSDLGVAPGAMPGRFGSRNVPTAMYAKFSPVFHFELQDGEETAVGGQFWDGRANTLEDQAKGPFFNPNEMDLADHAMLRERVMAAPYAPLMRQVFGPQVFDTADGTLDAVAQAIAAYERTPVFSPFSSKYDLWRRGQARLSAREQQGLALFKDPHKGNCAACHAMDDTNPKDEANLFTDFTYDNIGAPRNARIPANRDPAYFDLGLCGPGRSDLRDTRPEVCGAFKVPTLRNVTRKTAYLHNGVFSRLRDVVAFYATRETEPARWYTERKYDDTPAEYVPNINVKEVPYSATPQTGAFLDDDEIDAIVAFLGTLEDGYGHRP